MKSATLARLLVVFVILASLLVMAACVPLPQRRHSRRDGRKGCACRGAVRPVVGLR